MADELPTDRRGGGRKARLVVGLIAFALLALGLAVLSINPAVENAKRPTAQDVAVARDLVEQVKVSQTLGAPVRLNLDDREVRALSILAGDTSGLGRVEAGVSDGLFTVRGSFPLVVGLWLNTETTVAGTHDGFPAMRSKVGHIRLPDAASRWSADFLRWLLHRKGVELPALDEIFQHFSVRENAVVAELALPQRTGLVSHAVKAVGAAVDDRLVGEIQCRLAAAQRKNPDPRLSSLVRQAFQGKGGTDRAEYNRAAFAALAVYVVGDQAAPLAAVATEGIRTCAPAGSEIVLRERADLAKHWAFSAALTAILGEHTAGNLGEWKELHDSLEAGSGFSFVDLAADRSGLHIARSALDARTAEATAAALAQVTEDDLLPLVLSTAPEGLSDLEFADRFGGVEANRYRQAVSWIDRQLAQRARQ